MTKVNLKGKANTATRPRGATFCAYVCIPISASTSRQHLRSMSSPAGITVPLYGTAATSWFLTVGGRSLLSDRRFMDFSFPIRFVPRAGNSV